MNDLWPTHHVDNCTKSNNNLSVFSHKTKKLLTVVIHRVVLLCSSWIPIWYSLALHSWAPQLEWFPEGESFCSATEWPNQRQIGIFHPLEFLPGGFVWCVVFHFFPFVVQLQLKFTAKTFWFPRIFISLRSFARWSALGETIKVKFILNADAEALLFDTSKMLTGLFF